MKRGVCQINSREYMIAMHKAVSCIALHLIRRFILLLCNYRCLTSKYGLRQFVCFRPFMPIKSRLWLSPLGLR